MQSPLLSICIPTYNREKYLQECLESIIHQEGFNTDDIEIVISDNASQDGTTKLVESYKEKYPNIQYFRNTENIGADRNVIAALKRGSGAYLWGCSDDDIILPGSFLKLRESLQEAQDQDVWLIQTNFNVLDHDGKAFSREAYLPAQNGTKIYNTIPELYQSYNYCHNGLSFFSIDIFSSKIHQFDLDTIPVTQYPHSCIMGLISDKKALFINYNAIGFRQNNSSSVVNAKDFFRIFVINHAQYMIYLRSIGSSISQMRLLYIALKMVIYTIYLSVKLPVQNLTKRITHI